MIDLTGRVAIVTGASRGIGRETAVALAAAGADVALMARDVEKLRSAAEDVERQGRRALVIKADVAISGEVEEAAARAKSEFGKIDILVSNAGITRDALLVRMKLEDWDSVINTNLTGSFNCARAVLPHMIKARYGRIINITSVMGQMGSAGTANYSAAKAGIIGFTKAVAREVASRGITVNAVAPGFIDTAMTQVLDEKRQHQILQMIPLGRIGRSHDVAAGVLFLASDEAGYITGQILNINGGLYM
jgi:3-oxoacyl-[acyl-carrier protein] reductase